MISMNSLMKSLKETFDKNMFDFIKIIKLKKIKNQKILLNKNFLIIQLMK